MGFSTLLGLGLGLGLGLELVSLWVRYDAYRWNHVPYGSSCTAGLINNDKIYYLMPSVHDPHRRARRIKLIQRSDKGCIYVGRLTPCLVAGFPGIVPPHSSCRRTPHFQATWNPGEIAAGGVAEGEGLCH